MTTSTAAPTSPLPLLLEEVTVTAVERLSPSFVRVELGSPALADLGTEEECRLDQRIKLIFPPAGGTLPSVEGADEAFMAQWWTRPEEERGCVRTYTLRAVRGAGADTRLVVDFVVHGDGAHGPGGDWGAGAEIGDRVVVMAPRRGKVFGGIEFLPGDASTLLIVGDETAVPAIGAILEQLDSAARGAVFVEVPVAADVLSLEHPDGVSVTWLPRDGAERGTALHAAVLEHLGTSAEAEAAALAVADDEIDPDLWETPAYSSSGETVDVAVDVAGEAPAAHRGLYAWIAGESKVVTGLRRALVKDLGIDRRQVAFMGYWRVGVAMKS